MNLIRTHDSNELQLHCIFCEAAKLPASNNKDSRTKEDKKESESKFSLKPLSLCLIWNCILPKQTKWVSPWSKFPWSSFSIRMNDRLTTQHCQFILSSCSESVLQKCRCCSSVFCIKSTSYAFQLLWIQFSSDLG